MNSSEKFNNLQHQPRILIAPLEWGLGHATRCIPLIRHLLKCHCEVFLAGEGATKALLHEEFPSLTFLPLRGYRIKYSRRKYLLPAKLFLQIPKLILAIYKEHKWLGKTVENYKIDAVISDNRLGLFHSKTFSIYITHQLTIKSNSRFAEYLASKTHSFFIKKYYECWVPDFRNDGIAGLLSHPVKIPTNVKYLGPLSRFKHLGDVEILYDLLIIISGPEPQRTIFEDILLKQLQGYSGRVLFVRGLPDQIKIDSQKFEHIEMKNHLSSEDLNIAMQRSEIIISRSGYTTLMDLIKLQKKAILIPTPGQTEQEYLSLYVMDKQMFYSVPQEQFSLLEALKEVQSFRFNIPEINMHAFENILERFVHRLKTSND